MPISEKNLLKLANGSDVRGVSIEGVADEPVTLNAEAANRITSGFLDFLAQKTGKRVKDLRVAVGHDSRLSAPMLKEAVLEALTYAGVVTVDCGLASTPSMFMSIVFPETKMDGSIMITASHLPYNRNGLKFFTKDGGVEHEDIIAILEAAARNPEVKGDLSKVQKYNLIDRYCHHLRKKIRAALNMGDTPLKGMHVVVDAGNGAGGFFATQVLGRLGADTSGSVFLEPDGHFPNHIPNPENKQAMAAIRKAVLDSHADLGLIFDTDVDRMSAVLKNGKEISRNALIAMMAAILAPDYPGSTIVTTEPSAPARAVRPERCRYALCSIGGSTWMTSSTSSTCTPRAATSVATSTFAAPEANAARLRSRAGCDRLPCRSTAGIPCAVSCWASFLAWCFVRMNRMRRPVPDASVRTSSFLASTPSV